MLVFSLSFLLDVLNMFRYARDYTFLSPLNPVRPLGRLADERFHAGPARRTVRPVSDDRLTCASSEYYRASWALCCRPMRLDVRLLDVQLSGGWRGHVFRHGPWRRCCRHGRDWNDPCRHIVP